MNITSFAAVKETVSCSGRSIAYGKRGLVLVSVSSLISCVTLGNHLNSVNLSLLSSKLRALGQIISTDHFYEHYSVICDPSWGWFWNQGLETFLWMPRGWRNGLAASLQLTTMLAEMDPPFFPLHHHTGPLQISEGPQPMTNTHYYHTLYLVCMCERNGVGCRVKG